MLVVMLIALIGIVVSLLTEASNTMIFQSNKTYLQACERNLIASGLAWSKINIKKDSRDITGKMIELDVTELNIRGSSLTVNINSPVETRPPGPAEACTTTSAIQQPWKANSYKR